MKKLKKLLKKFKQIFPKKEPKFLYEVIGQENGVYELVKNFYNVVEYRQP